MPMLAELADVIIGVDTHTDTHTAAAVDRLGAHLATIEVSADAAGYARLVDFAASTPRARGIAWAVEGCGSHGAGLARVLTSAGQLVIEADRPKKARRRGDKSDELDAIRAARQALAIPDPAQPRTGEHPRGAADPAGHPRARHQDPHRHREHPQGADPHRT